MLGQSAVSFGAALHPRQRNSVLVLRRDDRPPGQSIRKIRIVNRKAGVGSAGRRKESVLLLPTYNWLPARQQASPRPSKKAFEFWTSIRDALAVEHRVIESLDPSSPRIRPTLATSIGMVLR
jgi:hypothetical protein